MRALEERLDQFASNVEFGDCWLWQRSRNRAGYATLGPSYGVTRYAHRWLWIHTVGSIPPGMELDHLCRTRHCVNPDHLEVVSRAENMRRAAPAVRAAGQRRQQENWASQTHCSEGHEYTAENTYLHPTRGYRICRTCHKAQAKKWREAQKV